MFQMRYKFHLPKMHPAVIYSHKGPSTKQSHHPVLQSSLSSLCCSSTIKTCFLFNISVYNMYILCYVVPCVVSCIICLTESSSIQFIYTLHNIQFYFICLYIMFSLLYNRLFELYCKSFVSLLELFFH